MKIGEIVKFKIPSLQGMKTVAGTIKRILDDGALEIKSQQDGYYTLRPGDLIVPMGTSPCNLLENMGPKKL